jgi:hypothetical protein
MLRRLVVAAASLGLLVGCIGAGRTSTVGPAAVPEGFPQVVGINLEGAEIPLPAGFEGERNLVAVAFRQEQQAIVDTWIAAVAPLEAANPDLRFYEVPTIYEGSALFRLWVNNGMRSGIPDPAARARTITLYVDREAFTRSLAIPDLETVHLLLLDRSGRILWRTTGSAGDEAIARLKAELALARAG